MDTSDKAGQGPSSARLATSDMQVGTRHHLVPRFYLDRFARSGRIAIVNPRTAERRVAHVKDTVTERDFYTFVNAEGELDARMERLLSRIEGDAAEAIRNMTSVFGGDVPSEDRMSVCSLIAFQLVRGRASRRRAELIHDVTTRLTLDEGHATRTAGNDVARHDRDRSCATASTAPSAAGSCAIDHADQSDEPEVRPDPNEHIELIQTLAPRALTNLIGRRWYILEYSEPTLLTSDEPVSIVPSGHSGGRTPVGLATAREVYLALDSRQLLVLGTPERVSTPVTRRQGDPERAELANWLASFNAYEYVFMHPDASIAVPPMSDEPVLRVSADAFPLSERYNRTPVDRQTRRRRPDDGKQR